MDGLMIAMVASGMVAALMMPRWPFISLLAWYGILLVLTLVWPLV